MQACNGLAVGGRYPGEVAGDTEFEFVEANHRGCGGGGTKARVSLHRHVAAFCAAADGGKPKAHCPVQVPRDHKLALRMLRGGVVPESGHQRVHAAVEGRGPPCEDKKRKGREKGTDKRE